MKKLDCTAEEAKEILMDDDDIDHGIAKDFDLSAEKLKEANKYSKTGTRKAPTAYKFEKRQRKENPTKRSIIAELATFLRENSENACENVEITNIERMIAFHVGENDYELTLIQKRKPKNWQKRVKNRWKMRFFTQKQVKKCKK